MNIAQCIAGILLVGSALLHGAPDFIADLYPRQNALNIPADAELRVAFAKAIDPTSISDSSIYIYSDITGTHKWEWELTEGRKVLTLRPKHYWGVGDAPFNAGERVATTLTTRLRYMNGEPFEGFTWFYTVAVRQNRGGHFYPFAAFGGGGDWLCFDANGDRAPDVLMDNRGRGELALFFNDGKGKLFFSHHSPRSIGISDQTLDFDRNGAIDINLWGRPLFFNDGGGNFKEEQILPEPATQDRIYDFNNDGICDFLTVTYGEDDWNQEILIMTSKSTAFEITSVISNLPFIPRFWDFGLGETFDIDNDGTIDFIMKGSKKYIDLPNYYGFATIAMVRNKNPTLLQSTQFDVFPTWFYGNDFNQDGWVDYVFSGQNGEYYSLIYLNDGTGQLGLSSEPVVSGGYGAAGDIDGDGDIDLFLTNSIMIDAMPVTILNTYRIAVNRGNGTFEWSEPTPLPNYRDTSGYGFPKLIDLDLDGDLDIILSGPPAGQVVIANEEYRADVQEHLSSFNQKAAPQLSAFPNPFNSVTKITFSGSVEAVCIYNVLGKLVRSWSGFELAAGKSTLLWDGKDEHGQLGSSGIYLIQLITSEKIVTKRVALLR
jgi:hypothetical protein